MSNNQKKENKEPELDELDLQKQLYGQQTQTKNKYNKSNRYQQKQKQNKSIPTKLQNNSSKSSVPPPISNQPQESSSTSSGPRYNPHRGISFTSSVPPPISNQPQGSSSTSSVPPPPGSYSRMSMSRYNPHQGISSSSNIYTLKSVQEWQEMVKGANNKLIRQQQSRAPEITKVAILNLDGPFRDLPIRRYYKDKNRGMFFAPKIRANILAQLINAMDGRQNFPTEEDVNMIDNYLNGNRHILYPIIPSRKDCNYNTTLDQIIAIFNGKKRIYWKYQSYFNHLIYYYKDNQDNYCEKVIDAVQNLIKFIVNKEEIKQKNRRGENTLIIKAAKKAAQEEREKRNKEMKKELRRLQQKHMNEEMARLLARYEQLTKNNSSNNSKDMASLLARYKQLTKNNSSNNSKDMASLLARYEQLTKNNSSNNSKDMASLLARYKQLTKNNSSNNSSNNSL